MIHFDCKKQLLGATFSARDAAEIRMVAAALGTNVSTLIRASVLLCISSIFPEEQPGSFENQAISNSKDNGQRK